MFCAKLGWPLDGQDVADFIGAFVGESRIGNQFVDGKLPSRDFVLGFLKRSGSGLAAGGWDAEAKQSSCGEPRCGHWFHRCSP